MTPERRVIALLISLFGLGGYALVLRGATFEGRDELQVVVVPPARGAGASGASGASRAAPWRARLVVPSARSRVGLWVDGRSCSAPEGPLPGGPGLHLARWSSTHLGRRPRSVGWAYRVLGAQPGPSGFLPAAATVTISQEQLDGPAGDDVASALSRVVRRILRDALATRTWIERQAVTLLLGSLRDLRVSTRVVSGGLRLRAAATFAYGAHRLTVVAATSMEVVARGGQLHLASRPVGVKILGREALGGWRKVGAGIAHVVLSRAVPPLLRRAVDRLLPRAEAILSAFLSQRFVVVARDPGLHLAVRPRRVEASPGRWIRVTFDLRLRDDRGV
ncbi:MAG: hypothetical protein KAI47_19685, partial [Deltaproteobacteria bacterium]|nr:hypothetical protein [Deltaproteobacteria bacterium]